MKSMDGIDGCSVDGFNEWIHWIDSIDGWMHSMEGFNGGIHRMDSLEEGLNGWILVVPGGL